MMARLLLDFASAFAALPRTDDLGRVQMQQALCRCFWVISRVFRAPAVQGFFCETTASAATGGVIDSPATGSPESPAGSTAG